MALGLIAKIRGLRETVGIDVGHYSIKYVKVLHGKSGNKIVLDADLERVPDGCIVNGEIQVREGDEALYLQASGTEIEINGEKYVIVGQNAILLVLRNEIPDSIDAI